MYLYGAKIQGIQRYIFETNRLKEIVGASDIIENLCSDVFLDLDRFSNPPKKIIAAAGTIRLLFFDEQSARQFVETFPLQVASVAKGLMLTQALVETSGGFSNAFKLLEEQLASQKQRIGVRLADLPIMAAVRARRTGRPAVAWEKEKAVDISQKEKLEHFRNYGDGLAKKVLPFEKVSLVPTEIEEISGGEAHKSWVAVIHADGNQLGETIISLSKAISQADWVDIYGEFSQAIREANEYAAKAAISTLPQAPEAKIPFRPIVLGGDDFTAIVQGRYAIDFTTAYLLAFEEESGKRLSQLKLKYPTYASFFPELITACAGIAFVKDKFPFHYAADLAEELCKEAKERIKKSQAGIYSGFMFHKVFSSVICSLEETLDRELIGGDRFRYDVGPYLLRDSVLTQENGFVTVAHLNNRASLLLDPSVPLSKLRAWMDTVEKSESRAEQDLKRIIQVLRDQNKEAVVQGLKLEEVLTCFDGPAPEKRYPVYLYDAIAVATI